MPHSLTYLATVTINYRDHAHIHAAKPTEELQAITGSWRTRAQEFETFTNDPDVRQLIERQGIVRISYRPIRDLQRRLRAPVR